MSKDFKPSISVEEMAAYLDGNLADAEMLGIGEMIDSDADLKQLVAELDFANEDSFPIDESSDELFDSLDLPAIDAFGEESVVGLNNHLNENSMDTHVPEYNVSFKEGDNSENQNQEKLIIGMKPNENPDTFNPELYQGYQPSCVLNASEVILRNFGRDIPHEEVVDYCIKHCGYNPDPKKGGTPKEYVGDFLDACGVETTRYNHATIADIVNELSQGHNLMVTVDANELWIKNEPNMFARLFGEAVNKVNDLRDAAFGIEGANHALVVAGLNINPLDHSDIHVVLIDTGSGDYCIEYKWEDFQNALADSNGYVVATKEAAPYQYNYETHQLEPSGYESNFVPSEVKLPEGLHNSFELPDEYFDLYEYYTPSSIAAIFNEAGIEISCDGVVAKSFAKVEGPSTDENSSYEDPDSQNIIEECGGNDDSYNDEANGDEDSIYDSDDDDDDDDDDNDDRNEGSDDLDDDQSSFDN